MAKSAALQQALNKTAGVTDIRKKRSLTDKLALAEELENLPHPGLAQFPATDEVAAPQIGFLPYTPGMEVKVGMHLSVPLEFLTENAYNSREFYSESDIEDMSRTLEADGQLQPGLAYPPTGPLHKFMIKEGQTRLYALQRGRQAAMNVQVVEPVSDPIEAYRLSRVVNKKRNDVTVFDDAVRFKWIYDQKPGLQVKDLVAITGESASYIVKTQKIAELPHKLLLRMRDSKELFGIAMSYGVALFHKNSQEVETEALIDKICAGEISSKALQELTTERSAAAKAQAGKHRARPLRRSEVKDGGKGELKLFPKGRIEFKLVLADRKREGELYEKLREVFLAHGLAFSDETADEATEQK